MWHEFGLPCRSGLSSTHSRIRTHPGRCVVGQPVPREAVWGQFQSWNSAWGCPAPRPMKCEMQDVHVTKNSNPISTQWRHTGECPFHGARSKMATAITITERIEAEVCCPMCTHNVRAAVREVRSGWQEKWVALPGQKCTRCWTSLDAAFIVRLLESKHSPAAEPQKEST